jgi:hypothetical protein
MDVRWNKAAEMKTKLRIALSTLTLALTVAALASTSAAAAALPCRVVAPARMFYKSFDGAGRIAPSRLTAINLPGRDLIHGPPCYVARWLVYYIEYDWAHGPLGPATDTRYGALTRRFGIDPDGQAWKVSYSPSSGTTRALHATLTHLRERITVTLRFPDYDSKLGKGGRQNTLRDLGAVGRADPFLNAPDDA